MLRQRLCRAAAAVAGCDEEVASRLWEIASAGTGTGGFRSADGGKASCITPSGAPLELSTTGGRTADPVLRCTTEAGTWSPFLGPRVAAQRDALTALAGAAGIEPAAVLEVADLCVPDPASVPPRTRLGLLTGLVLGASGLVALKTYGNASLAGAGERWRAAWPDLAAATAPLRAAGLVDHFAAVAVDVAGGDRARIRKVYLRTLRSTRVAELAELLGVELPEALDVSTRRKPAFVCVAVDPSGATSTTLHVDIGIAGGEAAARPVATQWVGGTAVVDALRTGLDAAGGRWKVTMAGLGIDRRRLNLYAAPVDA